MCVLHVSGETFGATNQTSRVRSQGDLEAEIGGLSMRFADAYEADRDECDRPEAVEASVSAR